MTPRRGHPPPRSPPWGRSDARPRDLQAPITNALGRSVSPTTAERVETRTADDGKLVITPELTGIARELEPSINSLDARPDFSGERALAQAHAIRELISATIAAMRGELHRPTTAADVAIRAGASALAIISLGISAPLIARGLDNAAVDFVGSAQRTDGAERA
jgi:hypothetical protein